MSSQVQNSTVRRSGAMVPTRSSKKLNINVQEANTNSSNSTDIDSFMMFGKGSPNMPKSQYGPFLSNNTNRSPITRKINSPRFKNPLVFDFNDSSQVSQSVRNMPKPPSRSGIQRRSSRKNLSEHKQPELIASPKIQYPTHKRIHTDKSAPDTRPAINSPKAQYSGISRRAETPKQAGESRYVETPKSRGSSGTPTSRQSADAKRSSRQSSGTPQGRNSGTRGSGTPRHRASHDNLRVKHQAQELKRGTQGTQSQKVIQNAVTQVKEIEETGDKAYNEHLFQTFQAMKFVKTIKPVDMEQLQRKTVYLPKRRGFEHKKTVIFDLDETLVHCCPNAQEAEVLLNIPFPTGEIIQAGINIRPFVRECLLQANQDFEVIVFTASHQCYANEVLNYIDPTGELIHHRLYRDNCIVTDGIYIKDLRILHGRRMQDLIIVDNAAYSFAYQLHNGIPIISWFKDRNDRELFSLKDYLKILARVEDIRLVNKQTFHLDTFYEDYLRDYIQREYKENIPQRN